MTSERLRIYKRLLNESEGSQFILIYSSSIVKQAFFCLRKSSSNPSLEPTSTEQ